MKRIDLIKSMVAEELAWEFMAFKFDAYCKAKGGESALPDSQQGILEWLKEEVKFNASIIPAGEECESHVLIEPKSITRPELPDPPEPETVTCGEYVEITELLDINCPLCGNKTTVIYSQTLGGMEWYECFDCNAIFGIRREEHHG